MRNVGILISTLQRVENKYIPSVSMMANLIVMLLHTFFKRIYISGNATVTKEYVVMAIQLFKNNSYLRQCNCYSFFSTETACMINMLMISILTEGFNSFVLFFPLFIFDVILIFFDLYCLLFCWYIV